MCSMKWVIPSCGAGSSRAPLRTQTPNESEGRSGMASVSRVIPEDSVVLR